MQTKANIFYFFFIFYIFNQTYSQEITDPNSNANNPECNSQKHAYDLDDCVNLTRYNRYVNVKCCYYHYVDVNDTHYRECSTVNLTEFLDIKKAIDYREDTLNISIKSLECDKGNYLEFGLLFVFVLVFL